MSRRDQLKSLSAQIRTPPDTAQPAAQPPPSAPTAPRTPPAAQPTAAAPSTARRPAATRKTNLSLPTASAARLRDWAEATGRSLADGIITALINSGDQLEHQTRSDARRVRLGLPALAPDTSHSHADRTTVTIRVPGPALEELDNTARRLGLTRSSLAAALIDLHMAPAP